MLFDLCRVIYELCRKQLSGKNCHHSHVVLKTAFFTTGKFALEYANRTLVEDSSIFDCRRRQKFFYIVRSVLVEEAPAFGRPIGLFWAADNRFGHKPVTSL